MTIIALLFEILSSYGLPPISGQANTTKELNFAAAGDWGCNEMSQRTVNNIQSKEPDIVLAQTEILYCPL